MISTAVASAPYFGATQAATFWLMLCGFLVFFMQCGFALLEAGTVRAKNTKNILLKNLLDACIGAIVWWAWGFAAAVKLPLLLPHTNTPPNAQYQTHPRAAYR